MDPNEPLCQFPIHPASLAGGTLKDCLLGEVNKTEGDAHCYSDRSCPRGGCGMGGQALQIGIASYQVQVGMI